ncbi:MAG: glycosyltransferase family 9 protein, partial [Rickettsiales bacterium]
LIGTNSESEALESIAARVPGALNLCGKTTIAQLATLARLATYAVGNDTGPMHVIAACGCPSTVLFSHASDPTRSAPIGPAVTILRERNLSELSVDRVLTAL